jgi:hypothetical protein
MKREPSEELQLRRRKTVDMTERRNQRESGQLEEDQEEPDQPRRERDLLETIGNEFERTIESGDPWESFTRNTKRIWRGLVD